MGMDCPSRKMGTLCHKCCRDAKSQGCFIQGTHHPRDASSRGLCVQGTHHPIFSRDAKFGDAKFRDATSWHRNIDNWQNTSQENENAKNLKPNKENLFDQSDKKDTSNIENKQDFSSSNKKDSGDKNYDNQFSNNQTTNNSVSTSTDGKASSMKLSENEIGKKLDTFDNKTADSNNIIENITVKQHNATTDKSGSTTSKETQSSHRGSVSEQKVNKEKVFVPISTTNVNSYNSKDDKNSSIQTSSSRFDDIKTRNNQNLSGKVEETTSLNRENKKSQIFSNTSVKSKGTEKVLSKYSEETTAKTAMTKRDDFNVLNLINITYVYTNFVNS
jgi:hypothetical protein